MLMVATIVTTSATAQIRIIPREKRDSVANPQSLQSRDMLFTEGNSIDFGEIREDGGVQTKEVSWKNCGVQPITVTRITTSCGCVRCHYPHKVVENGHQSSIAITYAPEGHPGTMRHRIFIYTDRSTKMPTAILDIKGIVKASADRRGDYPHAIGSLLLRSRELRIDSSSSSVQTIRIACMNGSRESLTPKKDTLLSSECLTLTSEPTTLRAGEEGDIVIRYTPSKSVTPHNLRLFIDNSNLPPRNRELMIRAKTE